VYAVRSTTAQFEQGIHFIFGKSGSGKSTLLHMMAGLEKPTSGEIYYDDLSLYQDADLAKIHCHDFGFVFQAYNLIQEFTVEDNIILPLRFDRNKDREGFKEIVHELGIEDKLSYRPMQLSGGEQQRVAIARALVNHPKIIFADEPTGNLDEENSTMVLELLMKLCKKYEATLVMVTHDLDLLRYAEHTYQMRNGVLYKQEAAKKE
jgi:putative ABC transport system ATP-binding protein